MPKLHISIVLIGLWLLSATGWGLAGESEIVVTGFGAAGAEIDHAEIFITIGQTEKKAAKATRAVAEKHRSVVLALEELSLGEGSIITRSFSVRPQWKKDEHGNPKDFIGFGATHQIKVLIYDRDKIGEVIDASLAAGAHGIERIAFIPARPESAHQEALAAAVLNARERAEVMAEASGGRLGGLIELVTQGAARARGGELQSHVSYCRMVAGTDISPEEPIERSTVLGRWKLVEDE